MASPSSSSCHVLPFWIEVCSSAARYSSPLTVAGLQKYQDEAAIAEVKDAFDKQRGLMQGLMRNMFRQLETHIVSYNGSLPTSAPVATITGCKTVLKQASYLFEGKPVTTLSIQIQKAWSSWGYTVAHLASRSLGGEAGVLCILLLRSCLLLC